MKKEIFFNFQTPIRCHNFIFCFIFLLDKIMRNINRMINIFHGHYFFSINIAFELGNKIDDKNVFSLFRFFVMSEILQYNDRKTICFSVFVFFFLLSGSERKKFQFSLWNENRNSFCSWLLQMQTTENCSYVSGGKIFCFLLLWWLKYSSFPDCAFTEIDFNMKGIWCGSPEGHYDITLYCVRVSNGISTSPLASNC